MAICGFCKKKVDLEGLSYKKRKEEPSKTRVIRELVSYRAGIIYVMFSCPHCESILGFS
jgi:hypothetical protein